MFFIKKYAWLLVPVLLLVWIVYGVDEKDKPTDQQGLSLKTEEFSTDSETTKRSEVQNQVMVDIKGEVATPGVYKTPLNSRVADVIDLAGGLTEQADHTSVNMAQKVQDEMMIIITAKGKTGGADGQHNSEGNENGKIRINYASETEIQNLEGIGPSKAKAIVKYREENGLFRTPEDLLEVGGIGEKTLDNISDAIQLP
ncbi:helix-hairpin-helix domain-containing protein [Thalassobacillus pellis]|uniref:helix-hairpin-helix domain-containing protein n=1 Tax=Thalassobacillus pellis TaxID=748008 RepID=UPI001960995B|nr:helix-hairpin-helix domain-containing protein [Thalassobacillus pellis]MBM7554701.1 competence protein ComEA [Thalassobacillus pellis]